MAWFLARVRSDRTVAVLLVAPSIVAVGIFVYGFIGWTGYVSLSRWSGLLPDYHFVGADNYERLKDRPRFQADIRNTIVFTGLFLLSASVLGFLAATMLDQKIKAEAFFRGIFLFPMAVSFIVTGIAWSWLFNPSSGVNLLSQKLGCDMSVFDVYLKSSADDFKSNELTPSEAHGSAAPQGFVTEFNDIVFSFVTGRDTEAATSAIQQACTDNGMCA